MTGITWVGDVPKIDYELTLEAMRVDGSDFFCGLTFPVGDSPCSFIVGGWGGGVVGLSSIDGSDASENETTKYQEFESGRWYAVRLKVTKQKIEAWLDKKQMVNLDTKDRKISVRLEVELSRPWGSPATTPRPRCAISSFASSRRTAPDSETRTRLRLYGNGPDSSSDCRRSMNTALLGVQQVAGPLE